MNKTHFWILAGIVALSIAGIAGAGLGQIPEWLGVTVFFVGVAATLGVVFWGVRSIGRDSYGAGGSYYASGRPDAPTDPRKPFVPEGSPEGQREGDNYNGHGKTGGGPYEGGPYEGGSYEEPKDGGDGKLT